MNTQKHITYYEKAVKYKNTAKAMYEKKKFNNQTLANIASLSAELFMVSFLVKNDLIPNHHSLDNLIDECVKINKKIPESIINDVYFLEEFQNLCILESITVKEPDDADMKRILNTIAGLDIILFD